MKTIAKSANGFLYDISVERGNRSRFEDIFGADKDFGDVQYYRYLTVKGKPEQLLGLYDVIRAKSIEMFGLRPLAMPITHAGHQAIFLWPASRVESVEDGQFLESISDAISTSTIREAKVARTPSGRTTYKMRKRGRLWVIVGALLLLVLGGYLGYVILNLLGVL